jgi:hypothetical protein
MSEAGSPKSVVGIGNKGGSAYFLQSAFLLYTLVAKPDYSEAKIVVAMVRLFNHLNIYATRKFWCRWACQQGESLT